MDIFSMEGKTVVFTGGCGNLGKVMVKALLDYGANVAVPNRSDKFDASYDEYKAAGKLVVIPADLKHTEDTKKAMKQILSNIQDGSFAKDFLLDMSAAGGQAHFRAMRKLAAESPAETIGKEVRKLYSWSDEDKLINN